MTGKPKSTSFEIHVLQNKRWVLTEIVGDEANAVQFADNLLNKSNYEAVRVVRDFKRLDGMHKETVILEKASTPKKPEIAVVPVAEAPLCTELAQLYALPARLVMGRLFRRYLDDLLITPTELLHSARELKRFADKGRLLMSAIDQIATLQAPGGGDEAKARRDFLYTSWDQLLARARQAAPDRAVKATSFEAILADSEKALEDTDFQCLVLMSQQLLDLRGWLLKLDRVLSWSAEAAAAAKFALFDGLVADLLLPAEAIQDVVGCQRNLGAALCHMCDFVEGRAEAAEYAADAFGTLNKLFAEGRLPETRQALLDRIARELRGTNPLSRNEPTQEYEMLVQVLNRLVTYQGVIGGGVMAEALLQRSIRQQNMGGVSGALYAIEEVLSTLGDGCRCTLFLLALAEVPQSDDSVAQAITHCLNDIARNRTHIDAWAPVRLPPRDRMAALTGCNAAIGQSPALADRLKTELQGRTDTILAAYLEEGKVIEKIDNPEDPLAFRALRLVKFCGSGVLIPGKSLALAHQRVLDHLRQPQFESKFLASIPDAAQAERHLREFHRLLMASGFAAR